MMAHPMTTSSCWFEWALLTCSRKWVSVSAMNRSELTGSWIEAARSGSLLTPKHDPNNLSISFGSYRTILSAQMSASLEAFIGSGEYDITRYADSRYPTGAGLFEVAPRSGSGFSIVGSGMQSGSLTPTGTLDRLVFVSGSKQGWHVYAESSGQLSSSVSSGRLTRSGSL